MKKYIRFDEDIDYSKYITDKETPIDISEGDCTKEIYNVNPEFFKKYLRRLECFGYLTEQSRRKFISIRFTCRFGQRYGHDVSFFVRCPTTAEACAAELKEYIIDEYHPKYEAEMEKKRLASKKQKWIKESIYIRDLLKKKFGITPIDIDCYQSRFGSTRYNDIRYRLSDVPDSMQSQIQELLEQYEAIKDYKYSSISVGTDTMPEWEHGNRIDIPIFIISIRGIAYVVTDDRMHAIKYSPYKE